MDLKLIVIVGWIAGGIALGAALTIVLSNTGSRTLVLAISTISAASLLFAIQMLFELRSSDDRDFISAEYTIDRAKPEIRQWKYSDKAPWRISVETRASDWLAANHPSLFEEKREKIRSDLALFSLICFFALQEFDWQLKVTRYEGSSMGTWVSTQGVSMPGECQEFTEADVGLLLSEANNLFAEAPRLAMRPIRLPPETGLSLSANCLTLENPFCRISFSVEPGGVTLFAKPGTGGEVLKLPTGEAQYETQPFGLTVNVTRFALRAQHRQSSKYREWSSRVVEGVREWFQGTSTVNLEATVDQLKSVTTKLHEAAEKLTAASSGDDNTQASGDQNESK